MGKYLAEANLERNPITTEACLRNLCDKNRKSEIK